MELYDMVDGYYQDIEDGLTQAEPRENESDCGFEEVRQAADALLSEMRAFRSEEDIDDLSPEAWAEYKSIKQRQERQKRQLRKTVKRRIARRAKINRRGIDKGRFR